MSTRYEIPKGDRRVLAAGLMVATRQVQALQATREDRARTHRFGMDRLHAYAIEAGREDAELERELHANSDLGAAFRRILERTALHRLEPVAAASPGTILSRDGDGCRIRFQGSRAEPNQTYVIIELIDKEAKAPAHLFVVDSENRCRKFALPPARNGIIQFLVEQGSDLLVGLLDIKTEVFLR